MMTDEQIRDYIVWKANSSERMPQEEFTQRTIELDSYQGFGMEDLDMLAEYMVFAHKIVFLQQTPELMGVLLRAMFQLGYQAAFRTTGVGN